MIKISRTCKFTGWWLVLLFAVSIVAALRVPAAPLSGIYVSTADSLGTGKNRVTRIGFDGYSTASLYQGAGVNKPYAVTADSGAARAFLALNDPSGQLISVINLNDNGISAVNGTTVSGAGLSISGVTLDRIEGVVYYSVAASLTATDNRVLRVKYDGTPLPAVYISSGAAARPRDLAIDHGAGRLFIAFDSGTESWISAAALDGSGLAEVAGTRLSGAGSSVGGMVADTTNGFLYYTVTGSLAVGDNRIYRISYDGSERQLLYSGSVFDKPSSLALDGRNSLYAAFTGSGHQVVSCASLDDPSVMTWVEIDSTRIADPGVSITGIDIIDNRPRATTLTATAITPLGATLNGTVNASGYSTTVTFDYGTDISYGSTVTAYQSPVGGSSSTDVSASVTGLICNTLYHFRVSGSSSEGNASGGDMTFTTGACQPPTRQLDVTVSGTGDGTVTSIPQGADPVGISCMKSSGSCTTNFVEGTAVDLTVLPDFISTFATWGGDCSGNGECSVTMDSARSVTATFTLGQAAKNATTGMLYSTLSEALAAAQPGAEIRTLQTLLSGNVSLDRPVTLTGGWNAAYDLQGGLTTTLAGSLTIVNGASKVEYQDVKGQLVVKGGSLQVRGVSVLP